MGCRYLGPIASTTQHQDGRPVAFHHCAKRKICTEEDHGAEGADGPIPVCELCPLNTEPLVSAFCATYDFPRRLPCLSEAVESFLRQTWTQKELVIVNDQPGATLVIDHPQIRVLNVPTRFPTLGDKFNFAVEQCRGQLICQWDDDDIFLPWRMGLSVQKLGDGEYYNPKAYWLTRGGTLVHEVMTGYCHGGSIYRKSAWERVGRYESNSVMDVSMDTRLIQNAKTVLGRGEICESSMIMRYDNGLPHVSTTGNSESAYKSFAKLGKPGAYRIVPEWRRDYEEMAKRLTPTKPVPATPPKAKRLTVGMATYRDWPGVWATVQSLRLHHADCLDEIDIVVVDNDPDGKPHDGECSHSSKCRNLMDRIGGKYDHYTAVAGTAAAKGRIFEIATTQAVLVIDCHVMLPAGALRRLLDFVAANPGSKDLWQGPCIGDGGVNDIIGSHFAEKWGSLMYGQWATDPRVKDDAPFEIPMQGCGLFACNKAAWPGFHPLLRGFGPEEFHLHERIRRNGGKCYCLPWLRWCHRFGNPSGSSPPGLHPEERLRGHLITALDTRSLDLAQMKKHFVDDSKVMTEAKFFEVLERTTREMFNDRADVGQPCIHRGPFLRVVDCEVGCPSSRKPLPVFACRKHGECAAHKWQLNGDMAACLGCDDLSGSEPLIFRSYADAANDVRTWCQRDLMTLPIVAVCGVPRAGTIIAGMIAVHLNVTHVSMADLLAGHRPWERGERRWCKAKFEGYVLIVEDTYWSGNTFRNMIKPPIDDAQKAGRLTMPVKFAALYHREGTNEFDFHFDTLPHIDHVFEWAWGHCWQWKRFLVDMDGVICQDPWPDTDLNDEESHLHWLRNAKPILVPSLPTRIVTARLEKYRAETMAWCERNGIQVESLHMLQGFETNAERDADHHNIAVAHKAGILAETPSAHAFVESNDAQAEAIAQRTGRSVVAYPSFKRWNCL